MPADITLMAGVELTPEARAVIQSLGNKQIKIKHNFDDVSGSLGRIRGELGEFSRSLAASNARVLAFGASAGAMYAVGRSIKELVKSTVEVEKRLTGINTILGASRSEFSRFGNELFRIAQETSSGFGEVADAAEELARQGNGIEETLKRTSSAMKLVRISGITATGAVEALTAALNSNNDVLLTSESLINKLAAVDAKFAVSAAGLSEAIKRVGSVAADAGFSIDDLIAAVTSAQQTTARGEAVIGNSLKTIFTRAQRPKVLEDFESLGIATKNAAGSVRPLKDILVDLAKQYDNLSSAQQSSVSELVGGVYQINILKALFKDLGKETSVFGRALSTSLGSSNEASQRVAELNETLDSLFKRFTVNLTKFGSQSGNSAFAPLGKSLLKGMNSVLEGVSTEVEDKGSFSGKLFEGIFKGIGSALSGPVLLGGLAVFIKLFRDMRTQAGDALRTLAGLNTATHSLGVVTANANQFLKENPRHLIAMSDASRSAEGSTRALTAAVADYVKWLSIKNEKESFEGRAASSVATLAARQGVFSGQVAGQEKIQIRKASVGLIPEMAEKIGAYSGGYTPGNVRQMNVPGMGQVYYNTAENVKQFPGMAQPAIMPPKNSRAGRNYERDFSERHGFNPYAAGGLVPNFANFDFLKADPSKFYSKSGAKYILQRTLSELGGRDGSPVKLENLRKAFNQFTEHPFDSYASQKTPFDPEQLKDPSGWKSPSPIGFRGASISEILAIKHGRKFVSDGKNNYGERRNIAHFAPTPENAFGNYGKRSGYGYAVATAPLARRTKVFGADTHTAYNYGAEDIVKSDVLGAFKIDGDEVSLLKDFFSSGLIPNFAKFNLPKVKNSEIQKRLTDAFSKGSDYKDFYSIVGGAFSNRSDAVNFGGIASALSPRVPDYVAGPASIAAFKHFQKTGSQNVDDYLDLPINGSVGNYKTIGQLGFFGPNGARRAGLKKAITGQTLARRDTDKTRHYAEALAGNEDSFPIDTNVLRAVFGKTVEGTLKVGSAKRLIKIAKQTASELNISPRQLQAGIFKGVNSRHSNKYTSEYTQGLRQSLMSNNGLVPNFSALSDSVSRESQSVNSSLIRVGSHSELRGPGNPDGLGIYNLRDEPLGLGQGVERAKNQGLNPKTHGIPNFAPFKTQRDAAKDYIFGNENSPTREGMFTKAITASMIAPMVTSMTGSGDSRGGKVATELTDALSLGLTIAAFARGKGGGKIAAGAGIVAGAMGVMKQWTASISGLNGDVDKLKDQLRHASEGLGKYGQVLEQLQSAYLDNSIGTDKIVKLQDKLAESLAMMPDELRKKLLGAKSLEQVQQIGSDYAESKEGTLAQKELALGIEGRLNSRNYFRNDRILDIKQFGTTGGTEKLNNIGDAIISAMGSKGLAGAGGAAGLGSGDFFGNLKKGGVAGGLIEQLRRIAPEEFGVIKSRVIGQAGSREQDVARMKEIGPEKQRFTEQVAGLNKRIKSVQDVIKQTFEQIGQTANLRLRMSGRDSMMKATGINEQIQGLGSIMGDVSSPDQAALTSYRSQLSNNRLKAAGDTSEVFGDLRSGILKLFNEFDTSRTGDIPKNIRAGQSSLLNILGTEGSVGGIGDKAISLFKSLGKDDGVADIKKLMNESNEKLVDIQQTLKEGNKIAEIQRNVAMQRAEFERTLKTGGGLSSFLDRGDKYGKISDVYGANFGYQSGIFKGQGAVELVRSYLGAGGKTTDSGVSGLLGTAKEERALDIIETQKDLNRAFSGTGLQLGVPNLSDARKQAETQIAKELGTGDSAMEREMAGLERALQSAINSSFGGQMNDAAQTFANVLAGSTTFQLLNQTLDKNTQVLSGLDASLKNLKGGLSSDIISSARAGGNIPMAAAGYEKMMAKAGGYNPGNIRRAGNLIYNSAESVDYLPGIREPIISPPPGSLAGFLHRQKMGGVGFAAGGSPFEGFSLDDINYESSKSTKDSSHPTGYKTEPISGSSKVIDFSGRKIVIVDKGGVKIPFYLSSGQAGKDKGAGVAGSVPKGKWYPFFGLDTNEGWINKTGGETMANHHNSPQLKAIADELDSKLGNINSEGKLFSQVQKETLMKLKVPLVDRVGNLTHANEAVVPKVGVRAYPSKEIASHIKQINMGLSPTQNELPDTRAKLQANIDKIKSQLAGQSASSPISNPVLKPIEPPSVNVQAISKSGDNFENWKAKQEQLRVSRSERAKSQKRGSAGKFQTRPSISNIPLKPSISGMVPTLSNPSISNIDLKAARQNSRIPFTSNFPQTQYAGGANYGDPYLMNKVRVNPFAIAPTGLPPALPHVPSNFRSQTAIPSAGMTMPSIRPIGLPISPVPRKPSTLRMAPTPISGINFSNELNIGHGEYYNLGSDARAYDSPGMTPMELEKTQRGTGGKVAISFRDFNTKSGRPANLVQKPWQPYYKNPQLVKDSIGPTLPGQARESRVIEEFQKIKANQAATEYRSQYESSLKQGANGPQALKQAEEALARKGFNAPDRLYGGGLPGQANSQRSFIKDVKNLIQPSTTFASNQLNLAKNYISGGAANVGKTASGIFGPTALGFEASGLASSYLGAISGGKRGQRFGDVAGNVGETLLQDTRGILEDLPNKGGLGLFGQAFGMAASPTGLGQFFGFKESAFDLMESEGDVSAAQGRYNLSKQKRDKRKSLEAQSNTAKAYQATSGTRFQQEQFGAMQGMSAQDRVNYFKTQGKYGQWDTGEKDPTTGLTMTQTGLREASTEVNRDTLAKRYNITAPGQLDRLHKGLMTASDSGPKALQDYVAKLDKAFRGMAQTAEKKTETQKEPEKSAESKGKLEITVTHAGNVQANGNPEEVKAMQDALNLMSAQFMKQLDAVVALFPADVRSKLAEARNGEKTRYE